MISTVIVTGTRAPKLISNVLVTRMTQGNLLLEIATADHPTYRMHDSVLWAVNMSGSMLDTSSTALINATQPYARALADRGWKACHLRRLRRGRARRHAARPLDCSAGHRPGALA